MLSFIRFRGLCRPSPDSQIIRLRFFPVFSSGESHQFQRVQSTTASSSPKSLHSSKAPPPTESSSLPAPPSPQTNHRASPIPVEAPVAVGTLLDLMGDEPPAEQVKPTTTTTTTQKKEENLFDFDLNDDQPVAPPPAPTVDHGDLLGVDFGSMSLDKPILHRNASETVFPAPTTTNSLPTSLLQPEQKSSSNQNIDRSDPFKDLFSSSASSKSSSKETLAAQHAAATAAKLNNPPPAPQNSNFNFNLNSRPNSKTNGILDDLLLCLQIRRLLHHRPNPPRRKPIQRRRRVDRPWCLTSSICSKVQGERISSVQRNERRMNPSDKNVESKKPRVSIPG